MKFGTWFAIYFIVWWVVLFTVLPFRLNRVERPEDEVPGADKGAPLKPRFAFIFLTTTLVSLVVFAILWWLINNYWMV